jgi:hypothetical protein
MPGDWRIESVGKRLICRKPRCFLCAQGPEYIVVHIDCFRIYLATCTAQYSASRLWTFGSWRKPWVKALPVDFSNPAMSIGRQGLVSISNAYQLSSLPKLPDELLLMIQDQSSDSSFWKYAAVLGLADFISKTRPQELIEVSFSDLLSWSRGSNYLLGSIPAELPVVRISVDSLGINLLERLSTHPPFRGKISNAHAFIIEEAAKLDGVVAQLKVYCPDLCRTWCLKVHRMASFV